MPGALTLNDRIPERSAPIATPEADKPGFLDGIASGFRVARADTTGYVEGRQLDAYSPVIESLQELGYGPGSFVNIGSGTVSPEAVWKAVTKERAKGHFADLPETMEDFETQWRTSERQRIDRASVTAQQAGLLPSLLGGVAGAMTDPVNIYTLPLGGFGGTLTKRLLTEAAANMAIEGALMPVAQRNRQKLGREEMTGTEVLANIAFAGIGAAALRGAGEGVVHHWDVIKAAPQAVQERAWGAILERTPGLRAKVGKSVEWDALDAHLPDIAEALVGRENLTVEQRAAVDGLRAEGRFARSNPFADDAAGRAAQMDGMALAMKRIMDGAPALPVPRSAALAPSAGLRDSTAIASRTVAGDAISTVKSRIGIVESGGSDTAKNPRSSATGRYQFIGSTWLRLYRNRYGRNGLSDAQVLAKRTDGRLQEVLMDDLLQHNADALEAQGIPVDAGNLYLAHFAGSAGAKALHRASPGASARSVLGDAVVRANPFLERMNAREVIDWAARKMGGGGDRAAVRSGEPDGGASARIEAELETLRSEREALLQDAGAPVREDIGTEDAPLAVDEIADDIPAVREEFLPQDTMDEAVRDALPSLRAVVATKGRSINAIDDIADELGLDPAQVRRGLTELALRGDLSAMGGGEWHKAKPFRRSLVAREGEGIAPDEALDRAIEQGFFPELEGVPQDTYADLHDVALLYEALGAELAGNPRQRGDLLAGESAGERFDADHPDYQPIVTFVQDELQQLGFDPYELPSEWVDDLAGEVFRRPPGLSEQDTVFYGLHAMAERNAADAFAETGDLDYEPIGYDEFAALLDDADYRAAAEAGQRRAADAELAREGAADGGRAGEGAGAPQPLESGPLEAARYADYDNPAGEAAKAQKDSLAHDMRTQIIRREDLADIEAIILPNKRKDWQGVPDAEAEAGQLVSGEWVMRWGVADKGAGQATPFGHSARYPTREGALAQALTYIAMATKSARTKEWAEAEAARLDAAREAATKAGADAGPVAPNVSGGMSAQAMYAEIRRLPDTEESEDLLAQMRASLWEVAQVKGDDEVQAVINRWDEARDMWDAQFDAARTADAEARNAKSKADNAAYARLIAERVNAAKGSFQLHNAVRKRINVYGPGTVRERGGQLEVIEGRNWIGIPAVELEQIARSMGIRLGDDAPTLDKGAAVDPAIASRQAEEARLLAEAPMRGENKTGEAQDGTMGLGLFDAADQPQFRLDTEGEAQSLPDLIADIEADEAELGAIRDCLL